MFEQVKYVNLGIPTEWESKHWFKRYEKLMPKNGEMIFFDRSWYNRALIEPALGFCTQRQYKNFMKNKDCLLYGFVKPIFIEADCQKKYWSCLFAIF